MPGTEDITLRQITAIVAAADAGSLRQAARQLGFSQPGLSSHIAGLERLLSLRLLERRAKGVELTPEGREIVALARQVLDGLAAIADHAQTGSRRGRQTLRLGVGHSIGPYLLPLAVQPMHRDHPDLHLVINEGTSDALITEVLAGRHDMILTQLPITDDTLRHEVIFDEEIGVMMAADHPLAAQPAISRADLRGQTVLTLGRGFLLSRYIAQVCRDHGARLSTAHDGTSLDALRIMCAMGSDIAFAPEFYTRSEVRPGAAVVVRPMDGAPLRRQVVLAWRQSLGRPRQVDVLARYIRQAVAEARVA